MEAAGISQTLSNIYLTTRHDIHKFSYIELSRDRVQSYVSLSAVLNLCEALLDSSVV